MGKRFEIRLSALPSAQSPDTPELNKKQKHAKVMRERRAKWNEQQKQENKERSRIRMQNMRERKKNEHTQKSVSKNILTRHELKKKKREKKVQRKKKRQYRETLSSQKKRRIKKKKTKQEKVKSDKNKIKQACNSEIVPVQNDQSNQVSKQWTKPALRKAISRVKSALPRSPSKRQKVLNQLSKTNDTCNEQNRTLISIVKAAHDNLKGKTKTEKMARKKFVSIYQTISKENMACKV
ncbi:unnamed protein product [Mytilus coruscus]|uniref:Uncharacterized protein n=1 Tax=Mytilus coruscus TaxID=42192 RepID=A0A6J8ATV5_MYTCO|nr:unnamed protein product [Mytilus coruscus]